MNLLDYVSTKHVKTAHLEYGGEKIEFYYRDLTGAEGELVSEKVANVMATVAKQKKDPDYVPTSEELKEVNLMRDYTIFLQACDEQGNAVFESVEQMKEKVPAKLLDAVSKAIQNVSVQEAEKNSKNLNGSAGYSDSQESAKPALQTSSKPIPSVN